MSLVEQEDFKPCILALFIAKLKVGIYHKKAITKQLLTSISVDIRIYQPSKVRPW